MDSVVVHYGEIALKKGKRTYFENLLVENIKKALQKEKIQGARKIFGRVLITLNEASNTESITRKLQCVPGINSFAFCQKVKANVELFKTAVEDLARKQDKNIFMIRTKKAGKEFELGSIEVNKQVGEHIVKKFGYSVDLENPEVAFYIEIVNNIAFVYSDKDVVQGIGGLPTGSSGTIACLISGGIDSPVAAWYMMKRGCNVVFVHFYNRSITSDASLQKVRDLVNRLTAYQLKSELHVVDFTRLQDQVVLNIPADYRMIIYRRFMLRIAEEIARKEKAGALATGENLAQVASQTLENLNAISKATEMQIFRPLIGFDKDEIIKIARKIGTYEISIQPYGDCCSYMIAEHPQTKAKLNFVEELEKKLNVNELVDDAVRNTKKEEFRQI